MPNVPPSPDPRRVTAPPEPGRAAANRPLAPEEREAVVAQLSAAFANDVLPLDEFERRVAEAYRAPTPAALAHLVTDLPAGAGAASHALAPSAALMPARLVSVFSSVERDGRVAVPPRLTVTAVFGNLELDLRDAEFGPGLTEIAVRAFCGNVEVRLPRHVAVENHGGAILGSFAARGGGGGVRAPSAGARGGGAGGAGSAPVVRITGRAVLGSAEFTSGDA